MGDYKPLSSHKIAYQRKKEGGEKGKERKRKDQGRKIPKTSLNTLPLHYESVLNVRYGFRAAFIIFANSVENRFWRFAQIDVGTDTA